MTAPPVELTYGTIRWWVFGFVADSTTDVDVLPDVLAVNGKAYVTMDVAADGVFVQESATPATILKTRTELLIVNGHLQDKAGHTDVKLLANDSPGLSQTGWTYTIEYELDDGLTFGSFAFTLSTDEVLDLTMAVPLGVTSPGVVITKGEKGDAATITVGTVTTSAPGGAAVVTNVGTPDDVILDFTIPRGEPGPPAPDASPTVKGILQLAGELGGTAAAPTVVASASATANSVVRRFGDSSSEFSTVYLTSQSGDPAAATRLDYVNGIGSSGSAPNTVVRRDGGGNATMNTMAIDQQPTQPYHATRMDYVDGRVAKYPFAPYDAPTYGGTPGVDRVWARLATIDGQYATAGGYAAFLLAGTGDYGAAARGTMLVHFTQRGDNNTTVKVWAWDHQSTSDPIEFYTKQISTYVFELWAKLSDYNQTHVLHLLGSNRATVNVDSFTIAAPTGLSTAYTVKDYDNELTVSRNRANHTGTQLASTIGDSTTVGRAVLTAANAAAARAATGAGVVDSSDGSILQVLKMTQAAYDAIGTKSGTTLYIIQG